MKVDLSFQPMDGLLSVLFKKCAELDAAEAEGRKRNTELNAYCTVNARSFEGLKFNVCLSVYKSNPYGRNVNLFFKEFALHEVSEEILEGVFDKAIEILGQDVNAIRLQCIDKEMDALREEKEKILSVSNASTANTEE